jgi:hypothetical protein
LPRHQRSLQVEQHDVITAGLQPYRLTSRQFQDGTARILIRPFSIFIGVPRPFRGRRPDARQAQVFARDEFHVDAADFLPRHGGLCPRLAHLDQLGGCACTTPLSRMSSSAAPQHRKERLIVRN